jgi:hypothetical protein
MKTRTILVAALLIGIIGTGIFLNNIGAATKTEIASTEKSPEQFIVLLDLSDRIIKPGQVDADKQLIKKSFEEFEKKVHTHLVINSRDRFQVCIAPQKNLPFDKDIESQALTLDLSTIKAAEKLKRIKIFKESLSAKLDNLYSKAYIGDDSRKYQGSNIWQFFNESLPELASNKIMTKLVVITDGYFDFEQNNAELKDANLSTTTTFFSQVRKKQNWKSEIEKNGYGILPIKNSIKNISVCVSEIRSKCNNNLNEVDMLQYIWLKWLIKNGVSESSCHTILHGNISNTNNQLSVFLDQTI